MRQSLSILMIACAAFAFADDVQTLEQRIEKRRAEIARAKEHERAEDYAKLAVELTDLAGEQYDADDAAVADKTIASVADAAKHALSSARMKRKEMKRAEIKLRECERKLSELQRKLPSTEQVPIKRAIDEVHKVRTALLETMFK
jgi:hypothetical protein